MEEARKGQLLSIARGNEIVPAPPAGKDEHTDEEWHHRVRPAAYGLEYNRAGNVGFFDGMPENVKLKIRLNFRRKSMGLVVVQLLFVLAVVAACNFTAAREALVNFWEEDDDVPPAHNMGKEKYKNWIYGWIFSVISFIVLLGALQAYRDESPKNYWILCALTVVEAAWLGTGTVFFKGSSNVQMCSYLFVGILTTTIGSAFRWPTRDRHGEWKYELLEVNRVPAFMGQLALVVFAVTLFLQNRYSSTQNFFTALFWAQLFHAYFACEIHKIDTQLNPDRYMLGVVYFYADLVATSIACCCFAITCGTCEVI